MSFSLGTSKADHAWMLDHGFAWEPTNNQYTRRVGSSLQCVSFNWSPRKTGIEGFWSAVASRPGEAANFGLDLVVRHHEQTTSPVVCYVSAEVRGWRGQ